MNNLQFNEQGLLPVIVQDQDTMQVLMLAYMNQEAINKTLETKDMYYFSRSRQTLWRKGETSGNTQKLKQLSYDCDQDTLLAIVKQTGPACHTNNISCFYRDAYKEDYQQKSTILEDLYKLITTRKNDMPEGSYTTYLFEKGIDKILKKVAEETGEVIIAAKNTDPNELVYESADLLYHLLVLLVNQNIDITRVFAELEKRRK
jgi:phosphoribosyl-ATP pyrophosphohydrolase/phosphoribosyl-AMP cyclohydrolase